LLQRKFALVGHTHSFDDLNGSLLGIEDLTDPNADRILFWDDSAGSVQWLEVGTGLQISGTTLSSTLTAYTDEMAQDAIGAALTDSSTVDFAYNDGANTISADVKFPLLASDGSAAAPSYGFSSDTDTGVYLAAAGDMRFASGGSAKLAVATNVSLEGGALLFINDGTVGSPAILFNNDSNTGIYRAGADDFRLVTGGSAKLAIGTNVSLESGAVLFINDGSVGTPGLLFNSDSNTGIYRVGADSMGFSTSGTNRMQIGTALIQALLPVRIEAAASNGAASTLVLGNGSSTTATAGGQTLPSNPSGFLNFILNGTAIRVPYYGA
jgi:hypothetical protein